MNRFLTDKATKKRWWEIPVGGFFVLLGTIATEDTISTYWMYRYANPISRATVTALTFLIWLPIYRILRWHVWKHRAKLISERLIGLDVDQIPLATLDSVLEIRHAERKIDDLVKHGFLKGILNDGMNLIIDLQQQIPGQTVGETAVTNPGVDEPIPGRDGPIPGVISPMDTLRKIRWLNDEIDDVAVSEQIDQIEAVTSSILQTLKEKPERASDVARFLDYYLPAALKLLESYRLMEDLPYQGTNIQTARKRIEAIMAKLVAAMKEQQDRLFSAEALDVDAEIDTLEKMMAADGLGEL